MPLQWRLRAGPYVVGHATTREGLDPAYADAEQRMAYGQWRRTVLQVECRFPQTGRRWVSWPSMAALQLEGEALDAERRDASRRGGLVGGRVRAERLTPAQRSAIARQGGLTRWAKVPLAQRSAMAQARRAKRPRKPRPPLPKVPGRVGRPPGTTGAYGHRKTPTPAHLTQVELVATERFSALQYAPTQRTAAGLMGVELVEAGPPLRYRHRPVPCPGKAVQRRPQPYHVEDAVGEVTELAPAGLANESRSWMLRGLWQEQWARVLRLEPLPLDPDFTRYQPHPEEPRPSPWTDSWPYGRTAPYGRRRHPEEYF